MTKIDSESVGEIDLCVYFYKYIMNSCDVCGNSFLTIVAAVFKNVGILVAIGASLFVQLF